MVGRWTGYPMDASGKNYKTYCRTERSRVKNENYNTTDGVLTVASASLPEIRKYSENKIYAYGKSPTRPTEKGNELKEESALGSRIELREGESYARSVKGWRRTPADVDRWRLPMDDIDCRVLWRRLVDAKVFLGIHRMETENLPDDDGEMPESTDFRWMNTEKPPDDGRKRATSTDLHWMVDGNLADGALSGDRRQRPASDVLQWTSTGSWPASDGRWWMAERHPPEGTACGGAGVLLEKAVPSTSNSPILLNT
ncbi:hypothetical protein B0H12DRAFT_1260355 [Mycena haematopus]|nr:hypothetical protein B0H12DRAFT_1260355 [Mycena haematopus]